MGHFEFDIPFPKEQKELFLRLVSEARKCSVLSVNYYVHRPDDPPYFLDFVFDAKNSIETNLPEDPVPGFEVLGLVRITGEHNIFLTPKAFKWADYEKKNRFLKWWIRLPNVLKDIMLVIAFILSLVLTILQILEKFKTSPVP